MKAADPVNFKDVLTVIYIAFDCDCTTPCGMCILIVLLIRTLSARHMLVLGYKRDLVVGTSSSR